MEDDINLSVWYLYFPFIGQFREKLQQWEFASLAVFLLKSLPALRIFLPASDFIKRERRRGRGNGEEQSQCGISWSVSLMGFFCCCCWHLSKFQRSSLHVCFMKAKNKNKNVMLCCPAHPSLQSKGVRTFYLVFVCLFVCSCPDFKKYYF